LKGWDADKMIIIQYKKMFEKVKLPAFLTLLLIFHLKFVDNFKKTHKIGVMCLLHVLLNIVQGSSEF
jgi:hypothetical protein